MHPLRTRVRGRGPSRRALAAAGGLLLALALSAAAVAHAAIETATPPNEAVLTEPPTEVVITYTEGLDDGSSIVLKDSTGATIAVPLFISEGEWIKVDTRNRSYLERSKAPSKAP